MTAPPLSPTPASEPAHTTTTGPAGAPVGASLSVWAYVAFTGVVFGVGGLLAKGLIDDGVDAFTVTWFPFLVSGLIGMAAALVRKQLTAAAAGPAIVLGITASAGPALLFNIGFEDLPAGIVTLLISLGPVFTAVVAHFVFADERFNVVKASGLALAIVGVGVLATGSIDGGGSPTRLAIVLIGALIAGTAAVLARRLVMQHGAAALIGPQMLTAGVVALALSPVLGRELAPEGGYETWHVLAMAGFGVSTYLGFRSMLIANQVGTTGQVSVIGYCVPVFGVIGGIFVFGDDLTLSLVLGGLLILVSVWVIAVGSRPRLLPVAAPLPTAPTDQTLTPP
ncbi:MAG: DMT family transporter [Ilumatobacter sp.]|jgi:drug/metabolite transporter (DMT)-like permease|uniref:DMT family transporter n=1 Tax=Ilumatobacter sp. TaxID=1967498 RepID=UPI00391981C3